MTLRRVALELGFGTSLRRGDTTAAACRAVENALWRNSLTIAPAFGFPKDAMQITVDIAAQDPDSVDRAAVAALFPYGQVQVTTSLGGLDIPKPGPKPGGDGRTVVVNAAITVAFDMEPA